MEYSIDIQPTIDIDWFAVDVNNVVIHFASGGGLLPKSIATSKSDADLLSTFARSLPDINSKYLINESVDKIVGLTNISDKKSYLHDFISMTKKGFYSFDKSEPGNFSNRTYHLVSSPLIPISIKNFPDNFKAILEKTRLTTNVDEIREIILSKEGQIIN